MGSGTQGLSFLKKARKEIEPVKGRKCRICRKGAEGANSQAWNVQPGPSFPAPVLLPWLVGPGGKTGESASSLGRGQQGAAGESLSGQMLEERPLTLSHENGCP